MKTFEQFITSWTITEDISLEEAEKILEGAYHTEFSAHRDLADYAREIAATKKKTIPVVHVKDKSGSIIRTYRDPATFNRNKAMHVSANHTFHRDTEAV